MQDDQRGKAGLAGWGEPLRARRGQREGAREHPSLFSMCRSQSVHYLKISHPALLTRRILIPKNHLSCHFIFKPESSKTSRPNALQYLKQPSHIHAFPQISDVQPDLLALLLLPHDGVLSLSVRGTL